MIETRNRGGLVNLSVHIITVVLVAAVTDALLRTLGWSQPRNEIWPTFAPRGATIGAIWVVLFGCMGAARWLVMRTRSPQASRNANFVAGLILLCLAYPFYTHFIPGHRTELVGNIVSFSVAIVVARRVWRQSSVASLLIALVAGWIAFATVLVFALAKLNGW